MKIIVNLTGRDCIVRPEDILLSSPASDPDAIVDFGARLRLRLSYDQGKALWSELSRRYDLPPAGRPARSEVDPV
jgi:hypothetical protein